MNQHLINESSKNSPPRYPQVGYPQAGPPQVGYPQAGPPQASYPQGAPQVVQLSYSPTEYPTAHPPGMLPSPPHEEIGYSPSANVGEDGVEFKLFDFNEKSIRRSFIRKVYGILMSQLLVTLSFIAFFMYHEPTKFWVRRHVETVYISFGVTLVCIIAICCFTSARRKAPMNFIFLGVFTVAESYMLGVVTAFSDVSAVLMAVGITAAVCLTLTIFAFQTKLDFTIMSGFLLCVLVVFTIMGIAFIFIPKTQMMMLVYSCIGALIFSLYLVYDTQLMMGGKHKYSISPEEYIFAALNLYLDIINIFIYVLRIVAAGR